jgi:hypothetical protein
VLSLGPALSEYQILKPGGKSVCEHANRKVGFNVAQQELEALLFKRQAEKKKREPPDHPSSAERRIR